MNISDRRQLLIDAGTRAQRTINDLDAAYAGGMPQAGINADNKRIIMLVVNER
ncbi:hypothetical protein D3C80_2022370 [compost metagenome]